MSVNDFILLSLLFALKHFIVDFPLQTSPYLYKNKGVYGHPGGLIHSGLHGVGTFLILLAFAPIGWVCALSLFDELIHYHIDWAKVNINDRFGWGPTTHSEFWVLLGLDQLLHSLTYILMIYMVSTI